MRRLLWLICLGFTVSSMGCFLDEMRRDDHRLMKTGGSSKAREIENNLDWGTL